MSSYSMAPRPSPRPVCLVSRPAHASKVVPKRQQRTSQRRACHAVGRRNPGGRCWKSRHEVHLKHARTAQAQRKGRRASERRALMFSFRRQPWRQKFSKRTSTRHIGQTNPKPPSDGCVKGRQNQLLLKRQQIDSRFRARRRALVRISFKGVCSEGP